MGMVALTTGLSAAGQPTLDQIAALPGQGFRSLINLRPEAEDPDQPGHPAEAAAAGAAGLAYRYIPVRGTDLTRADLRAFQTALAELPGPVLAHCKGGTRVATLFALSEALAGRMDAQGIAALGAATGYDLQRAQDWWAADQALPAVVEGFYDPRTFSVQYVVSDPATGRCAIIDPVLDYDEKSGSTATRSADAILAHVARQGLVVDWILDTHPHADHFSAARYLAAQTGAPTAIGAEVVRVQRLWQGIYNLPELATDGRQWDRLFAAGETFRIGSLQGRVMHSPGHTLASVSYVIGGAAFIHDTLFMPDSGSARADFPGGSAVALWRSITDLLALPDDTRLFTGHDYQPGGRHPRWESTVARQRAENPHVAGQDEAGFVALREARDATLPMPKLILHALQVNIQGGHLPAPEANGQRYLKIPLDALGDAVW